MKKIIKFIKKENMEEVINLLQDISSFKPEKNEYDSIWQRFCLNPDYFGIALFDEYDHVIAYGCILLEHKIRGGIAGHIEDIVVHKKHRGKGYGRLILDALHDIAREKNCYKIFLACQEENIRFYEKCGFFKSGYSLTKFL